MATSNKTFCRLSFGFGISCLVFLIVSFASDHWVVSTETVVAGFQNLGLWSACFSKYRPPSWVLVDKYYDGCWWVFDREIDELRFYLIPTWFVTTQVLVTLSLVFQLIAIIIMIINVINCFPHSRFKNEISLGLSITVTVLHGLTGIFLTIAVILFGSKADNERKWLERPDQNYLSWSFGMCVLAAFLAILAFMTTLLESYRKWLKRKCQEEPNEPFTIPPPTTNMKKYPYPASEISHPPFSSRFSNQGSQFAANRKSPDIHSGRNDEEFYANQSHDVDEKRQRGRTNGYIPQNERHQEKRIFDNDNYDDNVDSACTQSVNIAPSVQSYSSSSNAFMESTDYEESKKIKHPVLPEYIPKKKSAKDLDSSVDDSYDSDDKLKVDDDDDNRSRSKKIKSSSKGKKNAKNLSVSKKDKSKKNHLETKTRKSKNDILDDERSRSHSRSKLNASPSSKRKSSHSRDRSNSRHRSHSRDLNFANSDSCSDSDSVVNSSRRKKKRIKNLLKKVEVGIDRLKNVLKKISTDILHQVLCHQQKSIGEVIQMISLSVSIVVNSSQKGKGIKLSLWGKNDPNLLIFLTLRA